MKGKTTLILLIVFVLLATFLYFFEFQGGEKRKERKHREVLVFKMPSDSITAFSLSTNNQDLSLKNRDGSWILTAPITTDADSDAVISNLKAILDTQMDRLITTSAADLEQYGLDHPRGLVTITKFGGKEQRLLIGAENPTGEFIYVKFEEELPVYTVARSLWNQANKNLFDLRDKRIIHIKTPEVIELEIVSRTKGRVLLNREGAGWVISEPVQLKANSGEVESYLSRLIHGRIKEFIAESPIDLRRYGLQKPFIVIHASCREEQANLIIGDSLKGGGTGFYAQEKSRLPVFTLDNWTVNNLEKGPFDFQEKKLITADSENVTRIVVKRNEVTNIVAQYDSAKWKLVNTESLTMDENRLRRWVNAIRNYEVDELVSYKPTALMEYGLEQPAIRIILYHNDLELGQILIGKKVGDYFYTKSADQPYIYKVKESKVHEIDQEVKDFTVSKT